MSFASCTENCHRVYTHFYEVMHVNAPCVFEKCIQTFNSRPEGIVPIVWCGILQDKSVWIAMALESGIMRRKILQE